MLKKYLVTVLILIANTCFSQVYGPNIKPNKFQLGFTNKKFYRIIERDYDSHKETNDWGTSDFYIKYGLNKYITLGLESLVFDNNTICSDGNNYRNYSFGADITFQLYKYKHFRLMASSHFNETLYNDRSPLKNDIVTQNISILIQIRHSTLIKKHMIDILFAPGYFSDNLINYDNSQVHIVRKYSSINNIGSVFGVDLLMFKHLGCFSHFVYLENIQPRLGINYQF